MDRRDAKRRGCRRASSSHVSSVSPMACKGEIRNGVRKRGYLMLGRAQRGPIRIYGAYGRCRDAVLTAVPSHRTNDFACHVLYLSSVHGGSSNSLFEKGQRRGSGGGGKRRAGGEWRVGEK